MHAKNRYLVILAAIVCYAVSAQGQELSPQDSSINSERSRVLRSHVSNLGDHRFQRTVKTDMRPEFDLEKIHERVDQWRLAIASMSTKMTLSHYPGGTDLDSEVQPEKVYEIAVSRKGEMRIEEIRELWDRGAWYSNAWNGEVFTQYSPHTLLGAVKAQPGGVIGDLAGLYFEAIMLDLREDAMPDPLTLPDVFVVGESLELVDGFPCHVVMSQERALWIDAKTFALRRFVQLRLTGPDDPGTLFRFAVARDFTEYGQGVWLPHEVVWIGFDDQGAGPREDGIAVYKVEDIGVNESEDKEFEIQFPPGTMVSNRINNRAYYIPKGIDRLDEAIERGVEIPADGLISKPPGQVELIEGASTSLAWLVGLNFAAVIGIAIALLWRRRGGPKAT